MTKDEALKLALEALENLINYDYSGQPDNGIDLAGAEAITAIKEALTQPAQVPVQRPWVGLTEDEITECFKITPDQYLPWQIYRRIEAKLKEKNT